MHSLPPWTHRAAARKTSSPRCSTRTSEQSRRVAQSQTAPTLDRTQFCRCGQQSSLQTSSLAAALASTNPGLLDRGHPKCAHLARAPKSFFFFQQKTAYAVGLGIPAEPLFRSLFLSLILHLGNLFLIVQLHFSKLFLILKSGVNHTSRGSISTSTLPSIKLRKCSSKIITSILSFISGRLATKSNQIKQLIRNGRSASLQRTFKKSFTSFSHSTRNKTRDGLIRVRNIRALNGRFNTSITHAYSIVIGSKHITLNATGGGFLTASKQFRHGATSKSRSNTASNSTKHKSPHLSGWRQIISLIT